MLPVSSPYSPRLKTQAFVPLEGEVVELSLLLPATQVTALESAAHLQGLTLGQLIRQLIEEFNLQRD